MSNRGSLRVPALSLLVFILTSSFLVAEVLYTRDGRRLEGKVIRRDGVVTLVGPAVLYQFPEDQVSDKPFTKEVSKVSEPLPVVLIETNHGNIKVELFEDDVPNTVANFVHLAETGFYDGTLFHRIIPGFVIQGGDPLTKDDSKSAMWGTGGPGWHIKCEIGPHHHDRGVLSMAHAGKDTGGSQFFIVLSKASTRHLDGKHTVFGKVIEGMDTVDKIAAVKTGPGDRPIEKCVIKKMTVLQKRAHEYMPVKN